VAWLVAGSPAHVWWVLASAWVVLSFILSKIPSIRANTTAELIFNQVNKLVLPVLDKVPIVGALLGAILRSLDTPERAAARSASTKPAAPLAALLPLCLLPALLVT
jgi:hypothetical protein